MTDSKSKICSPQGDEHKIPLIEFLQRLGVDESGLSNYHEITYAVDFILGLNV